MIIDFITGSAFSEVVSDAIVGAAVGAIATGAAYSIAGGSFSEGAKVGAVGGAIVAGGSSAWNQWGPNSSPSSPQASQAAGAPKAPPTDPSTNIPVGQSSADVNTSSGSSNQGGLLGWWDDVSADNKAEMLGSAVKGGAQGWMAYRQAEEQKKAAERQAAAERERYMVNPNSSKFFQPRNIVPRVGRRV